MAGFLYKKKEMSLGLISRNTEEVSVGEEGEGQGMQRNRRQRRLGNQQRKVWYEESD